MSYPIGYIGIMENDLTEIAFILDRSGSMSSMAQEAIGGFNAFIEKQKEEPGEANISLILFDHEYLPTCTATPVDDMPLLSDTDYVPRGMTALLDAMGRTIDDLGKRLADLPESERPEDVIVVTLTDGLENSSNDYTHSKVAEMIKHQREKYNWEFLFLGADLASTEQAEMLNIPRSHSVQYANVSEGIHSSSLHISERRRRNKSNKIGF
ncbi:MAG: vWA domain-containing protein [Opitutaceae bacterium]